MKNYLFLFTISPVQSFISQARKVQDLAAGSKLLSDLISEAIKYTTEIEKVAAKDYVNGELENDEAKKGQAIYAGGDDFLGSINLKYLFPVLKNLTQKINI